MTTVFFDVDTQIDFLFPAGSLYISGAEQIIPVVHELNKFAVEHEIPLISTLDTHAERDPEFRQWPHHCVNGTIGHRKPASLLVGSCQTVPAQQVNLRINATQILLEKPVIDCFRNENLPELLNTFGAQRYVLYGVATEHCVQAAAKGLLQTGAQVALVTDAIRGVDAASCALFMESFAAAGGVFATAGDILAGR